MSGTAPIRLIAWGLIALGGILLLSLLVRLILGIWRRLQPLNVWVRYAEESSPYPRRRRRWGWLGATLLLLFALVLVAVGWGSLYLEGATQAYIPFSPDKVVARIECAQAGEGAEGPATCVLALVGAAEPYTATIQGVRWEIEGEVLVWDPALERLGLRSGYRLVRLLEYDWEGNVVSEEVLSDPAGGLGGFFEWLDGRFPFVQARRQRAPGEVKAGALYELTVSREGFSPRMWESVQP